MIEDNTFRHRNDILKEILKTDLESQSKEILNKEKEAGSENLANQRKVEEQRAIGNNKSLVKLLKESPVLTIQDAAGSILLTDEKSINSALIVPELNKLKLLKLESLKEKNLHRKNLIVAKNRDSQ